MTPYSTNASGINNCVINDEHGLVIVGTQEGRLEAWDPRTRTCQATLDCAMHCTDIDDKYELYKAFLLYYYKNKIK